MIHNQITKISSMVPVWINF